MISGRWDSHAGLPAILFLGALIGCSADAPSPTAAAAYIEEIEAYRAQRVERLRSTWLTIAGLFWLAPGSNTFGAGKDNAIVFPADAAPEYAGKFVYAGGEVTLVPAPEAGLTIDGAAIGPTRLTAGDDAREVVLGRLTFFVIERAGRHAIRLRDPEFRARKDFRGIEFYPIDPSGEIEGRLVRYDKPKTVQVETVIGYATEMVSMGKVEFDLAGATHALEALVDSDDAEELFLIFKDKTTGKGTYGAGRYLYAPFRGDLAKIDFNKAYNPPCAFTPYATCPLPPPGNTLPIAIESGERAYHAD